MPGSLYLYRVGPVSAGAGQLVAGPTLPLRPLVSTQQVAAAPADRTARLQGPSQPATKWPVGQLVPAQATGIPLDVSPWGSGAYRWRLDTTVVSFYADDYLMATQPRAVLEVGAAVLQAPLGTVYTLEIAMLPPAGQPSPTVRTRAAQPQPGPKAPVTIPRQGAQPRGGRLPAKPPS